MSDVEPMLEIEAALASLKDFQRATVDTVYRRLFRESQKSMLIADEVGLGKTVVAKGVIARALRDRLRAGNDHPFKVTYICSNQVIAGENVEKLQVFRDEEAEDSMVRRIAYLAYAPQREGGKRAERLVFNSLTPGTSFQTGGTGTSHERAIIYALLCSDPELEARRNGLACLLRGGIRREVTQLRNWMEARRADSTLRPGLFDDFLSMVRQRSLKPKESPRTHALLGRADDQRLSIYDATLGLAEILRANNEEAHRQTCNEVCTTLRRALIDACVEYVDADLFILDEFQRFRDLINTESQEEEALLARRIFKNRRARILLLSATPFKALTGDIEHCNGEDHYRDFGVVLRFLTSNDTAALSTYEEHRKGLYRQLFSLQKDAVNLDQTHRNEIERILRRVICRTERQIVASDPQAMIDDMWKKLPIKISGRDVSNYEATDRLAKVLSEAYQGKRHVVGKPVEYCKSSPHPLSYLDGYALKYLLKECRRNDGVRVALTANRGAWLDLHAVNRFRLALTGDRNADPTPTGAHARLAQLARESIGSDGEKLLWIPPSMPYYPLVGAFQTMAEFSKVLVFSGWVMVPRMIATLVSYEVERLTIGNPATHEGREVKRRRYFPPDKSLTHKRHPAPLLVFRGEDPDSTHVRNMSNFCCLYPSLTLASLYEPVQRLKESLSLEAIRELLKERIARLLKTSDLAKYGNEDGSSDRWYWAAPAMLDGANKEHCRTVSYWLHDEKFWAESSAFPPHGEDRKQSGKMRHLQRFRGVLTDPGSLGLGPMPKDLPEVLADMALGSPAVTALRSLLRLFPGEGKRVAKAHLRGAFEIADAFVNLYNKPESICAVRLSTRPNDYWRQILRYGADGCLQAVLDEYGHLVKGQATTMAKTVAHVANTVNITASSINVDSLATFLKSKPQKMRCHYAVDFGNQRLETEEGQKRATSIRENFNSPFRPFVLATTSIGQEGLDFHQYCRKVMHWNLPGNPIDLEQREGRINRFKGLAIRQGLARKYSSLLPPDAAETDPWRHLFEVADREERARRGQCELVPYWHLDDAPVKIERFIPMYPFSRDQGKLDTILKTLTIYRLTFGQPRQVELIEHLLAKGFTDEQIAAIRESLMIDLSPISYGRTRNGHSSPSEPLLTATAPAQS